ncbi:hypothetical protein Taro_048186 [Colocasia esculenta]|uniref:Uncharacterized protein n=1 Tax=Colocasia esculenta TaxID=4460 RepID=A0A843WXG6_COLES|nr:hypothetical protein [Colocasia esculenta]
MDRFKLKLDIYRDYDVKEAVTRMSPSSHWEQRFAEREALSSQIDVDELFDEEYPLNAWVETRQEMDVPEFDPRDCSWAEGELDGVEARDPELRKQNIREAEEKDKGMDKGDMKDNNIMQPMSGHLGSQTIVQGLLIYLHFSLPFYRTQILVAHLMEYKEDGDLGLHKNKSLVALVKQQVHTNRLPRQHPGQAPSSARKPPCSSPHLAASLPPLHSPRHPSPSLRPRGIPASVTVDPASLQHPPHPSTLHLSPVELHCSELAGSSPCCSIWPSQDRGGPFPDNEQPGTSSCISLDPCASCYVCDDRSRAGSSRITRCHEFKCATGDSI